MKIGMRTIKTAIAATISILTAQYMGLLFPTAAGIIALLSVTNTKKSSIKTGVSRMLSLVLATIIAFLCFEIIGYRPWAFGVYLLLFIPLAVKGNMSEGIPVSSVLVTHYLTKQQMSVSLVTNSFLLMLTGVGFALLVNVYMPNVEQELKKKQLLIDQSIQILLSEMANYFDGIRTYSCQQLLSDVRNLLHDTEKWTKTHDENHLFSKNDYYSDYFEMRGVQVNRLRTMIDNIEDIAIDTEHVRMIQELLRYSSATFSEENDGVEINAKIEEVFVAYRQAPLPITREEFENRARLYQLLNDFQQFILVKVDFYRHQQKTLVTDNQ